MRKNNECKIIQDLLPSYIDKVTDGVTNQFVEKHLSECEVCKKILKNMNEEVVLDKVNEIKEINYLKKVKRRNQLMIGSFLVIMIIMIGIISKFFTEVSMFPVDDKGNPQYLEAFSQWITNKNKLVKTKVSLIIVKTSWNDVIEPTKEITTTNILIFDKKTNICIGNKYCLEGETEEGVKERYEICTSKEAQESGIYEDVQIYDGKLMYTFNRWINKSKEEIMNELKEHYKKSEIIEM